MSLKKKIEAAATTTALATGLLANSCGRIELQVGGPVYQDPNFNNPAFVQNEGEFIRREHDRREHDHRDEQDHDRDHDGGKKWASPKSPVNNTPAPPAKGSTTPPARGGHTHR